MPAVVRGQLAIVKSLARTAVLVPGALWVLTSPVVIDPGFPKPITIESSAAAGVVDSAAQATIETNTGAPALGSAPGDVAIDSTALASTVSSTPPSTVVVSGATAGDVMSAALQSIETQTGAPGVGSSASAPTVETQTGPGDVESC